MGDTNASPKWEVSGWTEHEMEGYTVIMYAGRCTRCGWEISTKNYSEDFLYHNMNHRFRVHYEERHPTMFQRLKAWWTK